MKVTFDQEFEYIPFWNNNRNDEKPVKARFRYMNTPEREKFVKVDFSNIGDNTERKTSFDYEGILRATLISLENLEVNGQKILNARDLIDAQGLSTLVRELADHSAGMSITPDLKN